MPLNQADLQSAAARQVAAAHDPSAAIRLVAGPGTGKSASIEQRYLWLLNSGVHPRHIYCVSFTRAASKDLHLRVLNYCATKGATVGASELKVTTLHSLALTALLKATQLGGFPVRPLVLDDWEVKEIFDAELRVAGGYGVKRARDIRREHEAFWVTGQWAPPNYVQPKQPITPAERQVFTRFHDRTTRAYACVLPGTIVRRCVEQIKAHKLDPVLELDLQHLIVDEYQDLNPIDIELVDAMANAGTTVFVAGDDDQSIYGFRFASPDGIQDFLARHPGAGDHVLEACFRSAKRIVDAANDLITNYSSPSRVSKTLTSLWSGAAPPVPGAVLRWRFKTDKQEAEAIARSAASLIAAGVPASEIMVLLSTTDIFPTFREALESTGVPFVAPKEQSWVDSQCGRFVLGILRIVTSVERDYVAYRLVLGCPHTVGPQTCHQIVDLLAPHRLDYHDLFTCHFRLASLVRGRSTH